MGVIILSIILVAALISVFFPELWTTIAKVLAILTATVLLAAFIYTMFQLIHKCLGPLFGA